MNYSYIHRNDKMLPNKLFKNMEQCNSNISAMQWNIKTIMTDNTLTQMKRMHARMNYCDCIECYSFSKLLII